MAANRLKEAPPAGIAGPTALPVDESQHEAWQQENRSWWEHHSMRYDFNTPIPYPEFSPDFYDEIDKRFFASASTDAPCRRRPFDTLIDFPALRTKDVLEIGCGNGSHA